MASVPIGRVAFVVNGPPLVFPVNFVLMGEQVVIRTASMSPLAKAAQAGRLVSFEADEIDERSRLGWSVLCHGPARLSSEREAHEYHASELVTPWIGGDRQAVVVISPSSFTGPPDWPCVTAVQSRREPAAGQCRKSFVRCRTQPTKDIALTSSSTSAQATLMRASPIPYGSQSRPSWTMPPQE